MRTNCHDDTCMTQTTIHSIEEKLALLFIILNQTKIVVFVQQVHSDIRSHGGNVPIESIAMNGNCRSCCNHQIQYFCRPDSALLFCLFALFQRCCEMALSRYDLCVA